jgi:hypothetical protein
MLGTAAVLSALLAGCATRLEMGPGYYHYDSRLADQPAPVITYREPVVVYRDSAIVESKP